MLYQTNAAKENMKVQLRTEAAPVYVESYVYEPGFFRFNWHSSYELLAVLCGAVDVYRDAQVRRLETDDLVLINPQQGHATIAAQPGTRLLLLHLLPESLWPGEDIPRFLCCSTAEDRNTLPFLKLRYYMAALYTGLSKGDKAGQSAALGAQYCIGSAAGAFSPAGKPPQLCPGPQTDRTSAGDLCLYRRALHPSHPDGGARLPARAEPGLSVRPVP